MVIEMNAYHLIILLFMIACQSSPTIPKVGDEARSVEDTLSSPSNYKDYKDRLDLLYKGLRPWVHKDNLYTYKVITDTLPHTHVTDSYDASIKCVEVYRNDDGKLLQSLKTKEEGSFETFHDSANVVGFDDVNFDGFTDIRILVWTSINLQTQYEFWVYDPTRKKFLKNEELYELLNPCFDPVHKTVHSHWRSGFMGMGHALHHWKQNKLELLAEEYEVRGIDPNQPGSYVKTEIINGKQVHTEREISEFTVDYSHACDSCKLHRRN